MTDLGDRADRQDAGIDPLVANIGVAILGDPLRGDRQFDMMIYGASVAHALTEALEWWGRSRALTLGWDFPAPGRGVGPRSGAASAIPAAPVRSTPAPRLG